MNSARVPSKADVDILLESMDDKGCKSNMNYWLMRDPSIEAIVKLISDIASGFCCWMSIIIDRNDLKPWDRYIYSLGSDIAI